MTFDRNFWGGISLVAIWLAVLFVGVFGGNVETHSAGGDSSSWPVVVIVAIVALLATVSIGRWAFRRPATDEEETSARQQLAALRAELEELRLRPPGRGSAGA